MADIRSILDPLPVDKSVKAAAWDAFHAAKSPDEFRATFDRLNIPQQTKAELWDARFAGGQQPAAPAPAPAPQPVPGADAPSVLDPKPPAKSAGQATSDFLSGAWSTASPITAVQGLAQAVMHPIDTASGIVQAHADTAGKAAQSMKQGDYLQGVRHALNTLIPLIGPMLDQSQEKIREGNTAEGLGEVVGMAAAPAVLRGTAQAGKAAAQGAKAAVGAVRRNPALANAALGTVSPRAAAAVDVVNEIRAMRNPPPAAPRPGAAPPAPAAAPPPTWDYSAPPVPGEIPRGTQPARVAPPPPEVAAVENTPLASAELPGETPNTGIPAPPPEPFTRVDPAAGIDPAIVQQMRARRQALDQRTLPPEMRPQPEPAPVPVEAPAPDPLGVRPMGNEAAGLADIPVTGAEKIKRARARVKAKDAESFDARLKKLVDRSRKLPATDEVQASAETVPAKVKEKPAPKPEPSSEDLMALLQQSIDAVNARKGGAVPTVAENAPVAPVAEAVPEAPAPPVVEPRSYKPLDRLRAATFADQVVDPGKLQTSGRASGQGGAKRNYSLERETVDALTAKDPYEAAARSRNRKRISTDTAAPAPEAPPVAAVPESAPAPATRKETLPVESGDPFGVRPLGNESPVEIPEVAVSPSLKIEVGKPQSSSRGVGKWQTIETTVDVSPAVDFDRWDSRFSDIDVSVRAAASGERGSVKPIRKDAAEWSVYDNKGKRWLSDKMTQAEALSLAQKYVARQWDKLAGDNMVKTASGSYQKPVYSPPAATPAAPPAPAAKLKEARASVVAKRKAKLTAAAQPAPDPPSQMSSAEAQYRRSTLEAIQKQQAVREAEGVLAEAERAMEKQAYAERQRGVPVDMKPREAVKAAEERLRLAQEAEKKASSAINRMSLEGPDPSKRAVEIEREMKYGSMVSGKPDPLGVRPLGREAEAVADMPKVDAPKPAAAKPKAQHEKTFDEWLSQVQVLKNPRGGPRSWGIYPAGVEKGKLDYFNDSMEIVRRGRVTNPDPNVPPAPRWQRGFDTKKEVMQALSEYYEDMVKAATRGEKR